MNWRKFLSIGIGLAMIVAVTALGIPSAMAAAQAPIPQPKPPQSAAARANNRLARMYHATQMLSERQGKGLERADTFGGKISEMIEKLEKAGKDPAALKTALNRFQDKTIEASKKHAGAASVLAARGGFDVNGKVIDRSAARETLRDANPPLREARQLLAKGLKNLKNAVKGYRQANSRQSKP